jgi:hypothetical protein
MGTRDIITAITAIIAGLAFLFSIVNAFFTFRQRATENQHNTRKALTDVVAELLRVSIAYSELDIKYGRSVDPNIVTLRRTFTGQRRYLANHGEFLTVQIRKLTYDIDCLVLANAFEFGGDYTKAEKFYKLAVDKSPTNVLKVWNLRALARFCFVQGNAALGRQTYEKALQQEVPDTDSHRQTVADTYLLWSRLEDEHGYKGEAERVQALGQQAAKRIGHSRMREYMLKQFSEGTDGKSEAPSPTLT